MCLQVLVQVEGNRRLPEDEVGRHCLLEVEACAVLESAGVTLLCTGERPHFGDLFFTEQDRNRADQTNPLEQVLASGSNEALRPYQPQR